jgi:thiamine biosynthesis protein ThiI
MSVPQQARESASGGEKLVIAVLSPDIWLKSRRTQSRMIRLVAANLAEALGEGAELARHPGHRLRVCSPSPEAIAAASRVFGVSAVESLIPVPFTGVDDLAERVAEFFADAVPGRSFAVRARRRGTHAWSSYDLACRAGDLLRQAGGTVDLEDPEVMVKVHVRDNEAYVVESVARGPGGLPIGSQEEVLVLISGGIDSPVAAWMVMSRGCKVDYLHFLLDCAQSDHALCVARALWDEWGAGHPSVAHVVDLRPAADELVARVRPRMRQVALKALMARAASVVAEEEGSRAVVTGESLGQVSSQTLSHLAALSIEASVPLLRPLVGIDKQEIVRRARSIGTYELSARAREVCDLSAGKPVEVAASSGKVMATADQVPEELWREAVAKRQRFQIGDWLPGMTTDGT